MMTKKLKKKKDINDNSLQEENILLKRLFIFDYLNMTCLFFWKHE